MVGFIAGLAIIARRRAAIDGAIGLTAGAIPPRAGIPIEGIVDCIGM
jgi:hypothetical protein